MLYNPVCRETMCEPLPIITTTVAPLPEGDAEDNDFDVKTELEGWRRDDNSEVALQLIRSNDSQPSKAKSAKNTLPTSPKVDNVAEDEKPLEQHKKSCFLTRLFQAEGKVGRSSRIEQRLETLYAVKSKRKVVFVGDVACGKTSFLMYVIRNFAATVYN